MSSSHILPLAFYTESILKAAVFPFRPIIPWLFIFFSPIQTPKCQTRDYLPVSRWTLTAAHHSHLSSCHLLLAALLSMWPRLSPPTPVQRTASKWSGHRIVPPSADVGARPASHLPPFVSLDDGVPTRCPKHSSESSKLIYSVNSSHRWLLTCDVSDNICHIFLDIFWDILHNVLNDVST